MPAFRVRLARISLGLLVCLATALTMAADDVARAAARPAPKAVIPFTSFSFGDVYRGEIISQIFVIRNEGDAELQIRDFTSGCGCEVTRSDKVIPPGKEGTATLEVQTASQSGEINKTATLHTNDPERPAIIFSLVANVLNGAPIRRGKYIGPVFLSPASSSALYTGAGKKATAEFSVTAENAPVKVLRVEGGIKHFAPRVEVVEPGRSYKIVVESLPIDAGGLYMDQLRVITDSASLPAFTIDMVLRVYPKQ
ncbi:MAG: DUF1573 domain-containing protein [Acidobacteriota bacterium]